MSVALQKMPVPGDDGVAEYVGHHRAHSEEYPERDQSLLLDRQRDKDQRTERGTREHREQDAAPPDEAADHRFFFEHPGPRHAHEPEQDETDRGTEQRLQKSLHASTERQQQTDDEPAPREFIGNDVMARVRDRDTE